MPLELKTKESTDKRIPQPDLAQKPTSDLIDVRVIVPSLEHGGELYSKGATINVEPHTAEVLKKHQFVE